MVRGKILLVVACVITVALDAKAELCDEHRQFTIDRDAVGRVSLLSSFGIVRESVVHEEHRFILEGRSATNDLTCDFRSSYQLYCGDYGEGEVVLSNWQPVASAHKGGQNQCVWDVAWRLTDLDKVVLPTSCHGLLSVRYKYEATVKNTGKLQVVDLYLGLKGCGKP